MEGYTAAEVSAELPENSRMTCDHTQRDEFRAARITELAIVADHLLADSVRRAMPLKPQPLQMDKSSLSVGLSNSITLIRGASKKLDLAFPFM